LASCALNANRGFSNALVPREELRVQEQYVRYTRLEDGPIAQGCVQAKGQLAIH